MNKQQLSKALAEYERTLDVERFYDFEDMKVEAVHTLAAAARLVERLLPGECGSCRVCVHGRYEMHTATDWACAGPFTELRPRSICPDCHGFGQVWDEGIVEAVAKALARYQVWVVGGLVKGLDMTWEQLPQHVQEKYYDKARAVLSAITELAEAGGVP